MISASERKSHDANRDEFPSPDRSQLPSPNSFHRFVRVAMSTWNLGIGDVSEETHALRNKLSSKGEASIFPAFHIMWLTGP